MAADSGDVPERPAQPSAVLSGDLPESFDDDLGWILSKYVERTVAIGGVLTIHHDDGRPPDALFAYGPVAEETATIEAIGTMAGGAALVEPRGAAAAPTWLELETATRTAQALTLPVAADAHQRVMLTTLHERDMGPMGEAMAIRLQPVLAGYFKLWLLNRAQRRRVDALASALDRTDIAILLLDGASRLVFVNEAARGLLDDADGLRRVGHGIAATEVADAMKLRVAIEHVIAMRRGDGQGDGRSPVVPLRRRGQSRALIATVLPVDRPPASQADAVAIIYVFTPDIDVAALLMPVCQVYGLSPAEARLVAALAEGLSVAEAAERLRVKVPTLRTYLKQIFAKTGTARQGDLMRLMMGGLMRTRHEGGHRLI